MPDQPPATDAADDARTLDLLGGSVVMVLVVAVIAWVFTATGCVGDDTIPTAPRGSVNRDFCDGVDYGLFVIAAPTLTFACWIAARARRSYTLASIGLVLGLATAVTPLILQTNLSWKCPHGTYENNGECRP
jgi:hypothetical protein